MPRLIESPAEITAAGSEPKIIREYVGRVNSQDEVVSVAHMKSPEGWVEPGQRPQFTEYTVVLKGRLRVRYESGEIVVSEGQAVVADSGEWVQYSSPEAGGAEYIAVCVPAFSSETVNRDGTPGQP